MSIKYTVSNAPLKLKEYGRNIQMMVDSARTMEDDDMRNVLVHEIVRIMINLNPQWKDIQDYQRKVWDHFYFLADFNIKVNSEFPMPHPDSVHSKPVENMPYHDGKPRFKQYGKNVDLMVEEALKMEDGKQKDTLINLIANIMRMHLKHEDRETNAPLTISEHLKVLSAGKINLIPDEIKLVKLPKTPTTILPPSKMPQSSANPQKPIKKKQGGPQNKNQNQGKKNYNR